MELNDAIEARQSIRNYSSRKVDFALITEILDAGRKAPFAGNVQTLRFVVVEKQETKDKLAKYAGQEFIASAPYIIVVCSKMDQIKRSYEERAEKYARQQAGAAIENMLLKVADLGLVSCWIGAFIDDSIKAVLRVPDNVNVEAMLPIANPMGRTAKKPKMALKEATYFEMYGQFVKRPLLKPEAR